MASSPRTPEPTTKVVDVSIPNRKVVTKMYTELSGDDTEAMLTQVGELLDVEKTYAVTILIEEVR